LYGQPLSGTTNMEEFKRVRFWAINGIFITDN
jgi:hypothetical protein